MKQITPEELNANPFQTIGKDWLLLTARSEGRTNTMTASWGGMGIMWNKPVAYLFIRPQRFTKTLVDAQDMISVSVLGEEFRKELRYFGTATGYEEDKIKNAGLPLAEEDGVPYYADARIALICRKLYAQPMGAEYLTDAGKDVDARWYPTHDWHTMYVVEIEKVLIAE